MMNWLFKPLKLDRWDDYLQQGEKLIWQGAPEPRWRPYHFPIIMTAVSLPSLAFGLFLVFDLIYPQYGSTVPAGPVYTVISLIFAAGFLLLAGAIIIGSWTFFLNEHKHVRYALSNKRAYIAKSFLRQSVNSYAIRPQDTITLDQRRFDNVRFRTGNGPNGGGATIFHNNGFDGINNGNEVYALVRKVQGHAP